MKKEKINLKDKLNNFYGTLAYHTVNSQYAITDGIATLLNYFDEKEQKLLIYYLINCCNFRHPTMFCQLIIKDNKLDLRFYSDLTEDGENYVDERYIKSVITDLNNQFDDCVIKTMIYNYVWLLMSEY